MFVIPKEIYFILIGVFSIGKVQGVDNNLDDVALKNFIEYLKIPSVHPDVNYDECVEFLKKQANSLDLPIKIFEKVAKKPIVIITWEGLEPEKPSILLNGHMDVVPVDSEKWNHPPFAAEMDKNGNIFARGAQDMKSLSIQQIEAIRRLKLRGIQLNRTIHISFVPDEEIGGDNGMKIFVETRDFQNLNVGFALDEGSPNLDNKFSVFYGEKTRYQIWIHCSGKTGHGSNLIENTAGEKIRNVIDRFMEFRRVEKEKLKDQEQLANVTSINLTLLKGGSQINVLPNELSVGFDIRIAPHVDIKNFEEMIQRWCKESGDGINYTIIGKDQQTENTKLDSSNFYWLAFKKVFDDNNWQLETQIQNGVTDIRYLRALGIPAFGFSPMFKTPHLAHDNDEFLNKDVFLKGIEIFEKIILSVANV